MPTSFSGLKCLVGQAHSRRLDTAAQKIGQEKRANIAPRDSLDRIARPAQMERAANRALITANVFSWAQKPEHARASLGGQEKPARLATTKQIGDAKATAAVTAPACVQTTTTTTTLRICCRRHRCPVTVSANTRTLEQSATRARMGFGTMVKCVRCVLVATHVIDKASVPVVAAPPGNPQMLIILLSVDVSSALPC